MWLGCPLSTDFKGAVAGEKLKTLQKAGQLRIELAMRKRNERGDAGQPDSVGAKFEHDK